MATLQKIRSKGTLLLVVIGLALLAFILGDAWKILRPNQGVATVGEVNGKTVNAQDYQAEFEKYADVVKMTMGVNSLNDAEYASVKDEVWNNILRKSILGKETSAIGLSVTDAEIQSLIEKGSDPMLMQTPFQNAQTGAFDVDYLKSFLAFYDEMDRTGASNELLAQYDNMYNYWCFIEDNLRQNTLANKYVALLQSSFISNPVSRRNSYESRTKRNDVVLATVPYSTIADSLATITSSDIKRLYAEKKPMLKLYEETRDIKYIDVEILPSDADRAALLEEVTEYADQLASTEDEMASFIRLAESEVLYSDVPVSKNGLPEDVAARLDSVSVGDVYGPYFNESDDSYNAFKLLSAVDGFDSIQFSLIQINAGTDAATDILADSIYNAVKDGADIQEIAEKYAQTAAPQWLTSASYEGYAYTGNDALYLKKINSLKKGELCRLDLDQLSLIIKVLDTRNPIKKYNAAIVKKIAYFSNETSNDAYNKLSSFVANNSTLESFSGNAEDNGYRLLTNDAFRSSSNNIGSIAKSHDALRWVFEAKPGEVSRIYEVGDDNDHLLVVALSKVNKKGFQPVADVLPTLQNEAIKDKKAEMLTSKLEEAARGGNLNSVDGIRIDTLKYVTFSSPSYVSATYTSEPLVGATVANLAENEFSAPVRGEGGVWVAKKVSADAYTAEYDDAEETSRVRSNISRYATAMFLNELYTKANVTDNRYKIF